MKVLVVLNDSAYGNERSCNATRLATALAKREDVELLLETRGISSGALVDGAKRSSMDELA